MLKYQGKIKQNLNKTCWIKIIYKQKASKDIEVPRARASTKKYCADMKNMEIKSS